MSTLSREPVFAFDAIRALGRALFPSMTETPTQVWWAPNLEVRVEDDFYGVRCLVFPLWLGISIVVRFQLQSAGFSEYPDGSVLVMKPRLSFRRRRKIPKATASSGESETGGKEEPTGIHRDGRGSGLPLPHLKMSEEFYADPKVPEKDKVMMRQFEKTLEELEKLRDLTAQSSSKESSMPSESGKQDSPPPPVSDTPSHGMMQRLLPRDADDYPIPEGGERIPGERFLYPPDWDTDPRS